MKKLSYFIVLTLLSVTASQAQVESEAGFMFVKAKYLHETDRHDDAIREFNKVINLDPSYENALILRAQSKYALAAYAGSELDAVEFIKLKGITPDAAKVLGMAQYALDKTGAASSSLKAAVLLSPSDPEPLEILGKMSEKNNDLKQACKYYRDAMKLGSTTAKNKAIDICADYADIDREKPKVPKKEEVISVGTRLDPNTDSSYQDDDAVIVADPDLNTDRPVEVERILIDEGKTPPASTPISNDSTSVVVETPKEPEPEPIDDTPLEIEIDEELTIKIQGQGLGTRAVEKTPNILILSESDGTVAIDVCVDKTGRITNAEYNKDASSLSKKSLLSLAIRKSKEFVFESSATKEQCGTIYYNIKGS